MKLDFDFDHRAHESIAYVGGDDETAPYRVRMVRDDCPENPFEAWEGNWPMIARYDRGEQSYGDIPSPLDCFTDGQLIRHQKAIMGAMDCEGMNLWTGKRYSLSDLLQEHVRDYRDGFATMADCKREFLQETLDGISGSGRLEAMATLFQLAGVPALCTSSQGYSQSHWAELLIVATPAAQKQFGLSAGHDFARDMQAQADLYGFWAWGDVYGYAIEERADPDCCDEWEQVDSCFGFYGNNPENSGLNEQAIDALQYHISAKRKERFVKLAALIRDKAALHVRQAILGAPEYKGAFVS